MSDRTVPSPTLDSFIQGVRDPNALAHKIVQQEAALGDKGAVPSAAKPTVLAPPDMGEAITRHRGGK